MPGGWCYKNNLNLFSQSIAFVKRTCYLCYVVKVNDVHCKGLTQKTLTTMNLFNEVSRRLSEIASDLEINITEIYQVASTEFYQKHSLPAFHEWGDGFVQGDASDEEVAQAAKEWDGRDLTEPNEFGGVDFDQSAIDDFLLDLDQAFMELYVEKANEAFAASKKVTENEVEREEVEDGNYVVVYAVDAPDAEIAAQKYLDEKDDADRYTYETNTAWPVLGGEYGIDEVKWKVRYNCFEN